MDLNNLDKTKWVFFSDRRTPEACSKDTSVFKCSDGIHRAFSTKHHIPGYPVYSVEDIERFDKWLQEYHWYLDQNNKPRN